MNVALSFIFNCPLIAYFLKNNYSLRQNTLKILRVWERSLTSVRIGVYLGLIEVRTWLGTGSAKDFEDLLKKSDRTLHRTLMSSVRSVHRRWTCCDGVTGLCYSVSVQMTFLCLVERRWRRQVGPDSGCVRSVVIGRVRSPFQGFWTSLELIRLWVAVSGQ